MKLSLQVAILNNQNNESSSSSSNESSTVLSVDCSTIDSGISLINSYISKKINLSHCKAIIISEELAINGVSSVIYTLVNNIEVRADCNIIISRCDASDFLENSSPIFESSPANYYELILNSSEYSGYVADLYLSDFYSNILSTSSQACAILGGINTSGTQDSQISDYSDSLDGNYKADETPLKSENRIENMGTAVFKEDKLVGELTNIETLSHLIVTNKLEGATITIPNPFKFESAVSVYISLNKQTENIISFVNGYPYIECNIYVTGDILSLDTSLDLSSSYYLETLDTYVNTYLENTITEYLYKTSKELKSDIADFGRYALPQYYTWDEWIESDWLNNYQNSFFKVTVTTDLQSGYLFNKI